MQILLAALHLLDRAAWFLAFGGSGWGYHFRVAVGDWWALAHWSILLLTRQGLLQVQRCRGSHFSIADSANLASLLLFHRVSSFLLLDIGVGKVCHIWWGALFLCQSPITLAWAFFSADSVSGAARVSTLRLEALTSVVLLIKLLSSETFLLLIDLLGLLHGVISSEIRKLTV